MENFEFLLLSSPQIDCPELFSDFNLNSQQITTLNNELIDNILNLLANLNNYNIKHVLIPGGLFDTCNVRTQTQQKFVEVLAQNNDINFYIAPISSNNNNYQKVLI